MTANNSTRTTRTNRSSNNRRHAKNLPESEVLRRKGRRVGSDDIGAAALAAKYAAEAGIRKEDADVGTLVATALKEAQLMALHDNHRDAAKKVKSCIALVKHRKALGSLKVTCRDKSSRKLIQVLNFFSRVHFNIASDILAALEAEELAAAAAEAKIIEEAETAFADLSESKSA